MRQRQVSTARINRPHPSRSDLLASHENERGPKPPFARRLLPSWRTGEATSISIQVYLEQYRSDLASGQLALDGATCREPRCIARYSSVALQLMSSRVKREVVRLEQDEDEQIHAKLETAELALARCPKCGKRHRVLPCDVLPRKRYGADVIEHVVAGYDKGVRTLRQVVWDLLGAAPAHTTLHGWTQGLGLYALGRPRAELSEGLPASRALEEASRRVREVRSAWSQERPAIPASRCRSEERRENLTSVRRFLGCSSLLGGLAEWNRLVLGWLRSWPILFRSAVSCTPIEHRVAPDRPASRDKTSREPP